MRTWRASKCQTFTCLLLQRNFRVFWSVYMVGKKPNKDPTSCASCPPGGGGGEGCGGVTRSTATRPDVSAHHHAAAATAAFHSSAGRKAAHMRVCFHWPHCSPGRAAPVCYCGVTRR